MRNLNRRELLAAMAAAGASVLLAPAAIPSRRVHGFVHESGKRGTWPLVVGLLSTASVARHEAAIELLRGKHGFSRSLSYTSTDRLKADFALALIDYYGEADDLAFAAVLVTNPGKRWHSSDEKDAVYSSIYRHLIESAATSEVIGSRHRHGASRVSDSPNLTQLAGFLSGCVYGNAMGVSNAMKASLTERLMNQATGAAKFSARSITI